MLSYEHIPPRGALNKNTTFYISTYGEAWSSGDIINPIFTGKKHQGGIGRYCYCERCNNKLGSKYDRSYQDWAYGCINSLNIWPTGLVTLPDFKPSALSKRVISQFIGLDDHGVFRSEYPELIEFVLSNDPLRSNRFRLFAYTTFFGKVRSGGYQAQYSPELGFVNSFEFCLRPCGFVLTVDFEGTIPQLKEITHFMHRDSDYKSDLRIRLPLLQTHSAANLDYRGYSEILNLMNKQ